MTCALCLEEKPLRNSHILPEFVYVPLYDENHRTNVLTTTEGEKNTIAQKGLRERLLCSDCEQKLGKLERYASLVINGGATGVSGERKGEFVHIAGVDYTKFKLFLLSLVWRASVSQLTFFSQVDLGPHQEIIRQMLWEEIAGLPEIYPALIFGLTMEPGEIPGVLIQPTRTRSFGHTTYHLVVPGLKIVFFISSHSLPKPLQTVILQSNGTLILKLVKIVDLPALRDFMEKFDQQGRTARL